MSGEVGLEPGAARRAALEAARRHPVEPTAAIEYRSQGRLLIIGEAAAAIDCARQLASELDCHVLARGSTDTLDTLPSALFIGRRAVGVTGYLGEFGVTLENDGGPVYVAELLGLAPARFDLILDLDDPPSLGFEKQPLGYYAPAGDDERLQAALTELVQLRGEFEKPKFFDYDPAICAHGNSQLTGCTRCLDVCPTGAIGSLVETVAIDPYYCQGGGSCATACPTGAITYAYPRPADTLDRLRHMLRAFREAGGEAPRLLFHDGEAGQRWLDARIDELPRSVLPVLVEEIGSVGLEVWLAALAYGARRVVLLDTPEVPASVRRELQAQLRFAATLLAGMGYPAGALALVPAEREPALPEPAMPDLRPATFAGSNSKRTVLFQALDALHAQAPERPEVTDLPPGAPLGRIEVDREACTLCMACVSVCPAGALAAGDETPRLGFVEANCVQCGLCETACPESAITLQPRLLHDREQRLRTRTLHEEAPFHCVACGTPFATRSVIDRMTRRLEGHWMFQDPQARRRLQMCGDCRVRDMLADEL